MSHLQRLLPPWSEGEAAYGSLRRFVRRRTPAITTSANSIGTSWEIIVAGGCFGRCCIEV